METKIIWKGNCFNPCGIATANRELIKALLKLGVKIQCADIWHSGYDFNEGLKDLNNPIDAKDAMTIFADYPQHWRDGYGKVVGFFLHEGTRLFPGWSDILNTADKILVPSRATFNLFRANGVQVPIEVISYGINPEYYFPKPFERDENYLFLSVNSWTGNVGDRKGTDILIKAFDEEFKPEEKVKLILKIGTFWEKHDSIDFYANAIFKILGHVNPNILINDAYVPEKELANYFQQADCFVSPTHGESFGLTIINAMACFPYNTKVHTSYCFSGEEEETGVKGYVRNYDGDMMHIKTKSRKITCTPNHPILTDKGWKEAKDLNISDILYLWTDNNGKRKTNKTENIVEGRRIGELVEKLSKTNQEGINRDVSEQNLSFDSSESKINKLSEKNEERLLHTIFYKLNRIREKLFSRNSRWGRNINIQNRETTYNYNTDNFYNKYKEIFDRLDRQEMQGKHNNSKEKRELCSTNNLEKNKFKNNLNFKSNRTIFNSQERALWNFDMVYRGKIEEADWSTLHNARKRMLTQDKNIKQERVLKVSKKKYKGKVYNLSTENGIYFANGILVHNCGIPVICTKDNNSGHMDFCRGKDSVLWIDVARLEQADRRFFVQGNMQPVPSLESLKKQMRFAFEHRQEMLDKGLKNAEEIGKWTWQRSAEKLLEAIK